MVNLSKNLALTFVLILAASSVVAFLPVKAEAKTIMVPDDHPTIAEAIANAADGDTILVKKKTYEETTLQINKTLSLVGEDAKNTTVKLYPPSNVTWILPQPFFSYSEAITINANDVKLSNFTIDIHPPGGFISATRDRIQITGNAVTTASSTGLSITGAYCSITETTQLG